MLFSLDFVNKTPYNILTVEKTPKKIEKKIEVVV